MTAFNLIILWLRGIVFTMAFITLVAVMYGLISFVIAQPAIGLPILLLGILPVAFGIMTEGKV